MRLLVEIYEGIRAEVGEGFPIAVKLNASDGVEGGFCEEDSLKVAQHLSRIGVDVIDVSGGSFEKSPVIQTSSGSVEDEQRGVYFADYATELA